MEKIVVIVVTYNGMKWINECLKSILKSSVPIELVAVDNCSSDETVEYIKLNFPDVILLDQKINLGFGKANNIGISYALSIKADFVFLINQDAFVNENTIEKLVEVSLRKSEYGILSPIQLDYSGEILENYFFKFMAADVSRTFYSDFVLKNELKDIYEINFIQAAGWLLPIKTIKKIGGFDPVFFHYGEDDNYCQRVIFHGLKIGVVSNAFIRHDSHKSTELILDLFSDEYFADYLKVIYFKYANINNEFEQKNINKETQKIRKMILKNILCFNIKYVYGYYKQIKILNKQIDKIKKSRNRNSGLGLKYLKDV